MWTIIPLTSKHKDDNYYFYYDLESENLEDVRRYIEERKIGDKDGKIWGMVENPGSPCEVKITEESQKVLAKTLLK